MAVTGKLEHLYPLGNGQWGFSQPRYTILRDFQKWNSFIQCLSNCTDNVSTLFRVRGTTERQIYKGQIPGKGRIRGDPTRIRVRTGRKRGPCGGVRGAWPAPGCEKSRTACMEMRKCAEEAEVWRKGLSMRSLFE